jgi:hypothetical protein
MDITAAQLEWILGCVLLFALVIGWPSIATVLALLREQRNPFCESGNATLSFR